jgi:peptidoglycan/LPS O-acetylase OafA/YrhL
LKPGYFIFLSLFLPLALLYVSRKDAKEQVYVQNRFKVNDYIPQFDSLRAIAVLMVIVHHWFGENRILNFLPNGALGVNIFLVLSGFLITGILLKAKKQSEWEGSTLNKATIFKNFYIRRTLRIFPIYYLFLIILWLLSDADIKQDGIYYFTYTSNILFYSGQFFSTHLSHLWSLAVEEQFYILWPWLIILVNRKTLPYLIALFLIIGVSSNYIFTAKSWWVMIFTPACFDAFAIGGFLAYLNIYRQDLIEVIQPKYKWIVACIFTVFILHVFDIKFLPTRTMHSLLAITIIYYCLFKNNIRIVNYILSNSWLIKIGKISYGVYLYHLFVPELWMWVNQNFYTIGVDPFFNKSMPAGLQPLWLFLQEFTFLLVLSSLSWRLVEKPINNFKNRFTYKPKSQSSFVEVPAVKSGIVTL